ncbi:dTDP-4-dehydrorhamnose reductase [Methylocella sp.]|uniref:dTDP-4-dehydrorhamnose reductase n=1 Tax=Methylocella sp. TaxID=1978226 RepID=UPI003784B074
MTLVLGAGGQLGLDLQRALRASGAPFTALTRAELDVADADEIARALDAAKPAVVVNASAYTKVDLAEKEVEAARRVNALGPKRLAEACAARGIALIHVSTDYVFDGSKSSAYVEDDPVAPVNVYGATKAEGEAMVRAAGGRFAILRASWVYGEFGGNFLKTMMRLARERDELRVVADQRGAPTSTRELALAILKIAPRIAAGAAPSGVYHFTGAGETSWRDFADRVVAAQADASGRRPQVVPIATADYPTPARRPANSVLDNGRFRETFGFCARDWREEVDATVAALLARG